MLQEFVKKKNSNGPKVLLRHTAYNPNPLTPTSHPMHPTTADTTPITLTATQRRTLEDLASGYLIYEDENKLCGYIKDRRINAQTMNFLLHNGLIEYGNKEITKRGREAIKPKRAKPVTP